MTRLPLEDSMSVIMVEDAQDVRDGAALRRLREALLEGYLVEVSGPHPPDGHWFCRLWDTERKIDAESDDDHATIAEAADKCREVLAAYD